MEAYLKARSLFGALQFASMQSRFEQGFQGLRPGLVAEGWHGSMITPGEARRERSRQLTSYAARQQGRRKGRGMTPNGGYSHVCCDER
jgi:hypothetical protein